MGFETVRRNEKNPKSSETSIVLYTNRFIATKCKELEQRARRTKTTDYHIALRAMKATITNRMKPKWVLKP